MSEVVDQPKAELIQRSEVLPSAANQAPTLLAYIKAVESGADLDRLSLLMDLHERFERNEARKAFDDAMASFRSEQMVILKSKYVDIPGGAKFFHAQLADVCAAVIGNMSKYGLRHRWRTEQPDGNVKVSCIISHKLGHSETTELLSKPDTGGNKSPIHAVASAVALLERYTLLAAVGLAARDMDSNPRGTGVKDPPRAGAEEPKAPEDFDTWKADARAVADEGSERLQDLWKRSPPDIRKWVVTYEMAWWADCKAIAAKATKKATGAA